MVLEAQICALIDYLEGHRDLALGHIGRTMEGRSLSRRLWVDIAAILNAVSPDCPSKTAVEWRSVCYTISILNYLPNSSLTFNALCYVLECILNLFCCFFSSIMNSNPNMHAQATDRLAAAVERIGDIISLALAPSLSKVVFFLNTWLFKNSSVTY